MCDNKIQEYSNNNDIRKHSKITDYILEELKLLHVLSLSGMSHCDQMGTAKEPSIVVASGKTRQVHSKALQGPNFSLVSELLQAVQDIGNVTQSQTNFEQKNGKSTLEFHARMLGRFFVLMVM